MQFSDPLVLMLAAGRGTRLGKLTSDTPKPMLNVGNVRLIELAIWHLKRSGLREIVVNLFYLGEKIAGYLGDGTRYGLIISYSRENPILDTGGAILKVMSENPGRDLLVFNSDAVFGKDFELRRFIESFYLSNPPSIASMVLVPGSGTLPISAARQPDSSYRITRVLNSDVLPAPNQVDFEFSGVHLLSKRVFPHMNGLGTVFSSTRDLYPRLLKSGEIVTGYFHQGYWCDSGTEDRLAEVRKAVKLGTVCGDLD